MTTTKKKKISVIGLGKLGTCYAAFYASRGYSILGYDINHSNIELVNKGEAPVREPGLDELMKKYRGRIRATQNPERILNETDITFIIVPTPSKKDGIFSLKHIISTAKVFGPHLKSKKDHHTFVVVSTVLPEDSRGHIIPAFEEHSGKTCGVHFSYAYSPSLIAIGDTLRNLENPDFLFLGAFDDRARQALTNIYTHVYKNKKSIEHTSIESAELAKIGLNSYVTMKITFANILGELCSRLPHADVDEITTALGKDNRIGKSFFRSGLGYGGPCFPRDNFAFAGMAKKYGVRTPLALATHTLNDTVWKRMFSLIQTAAENNKAPVIAFLGLAYKPNTTITEDSQALFIAQELIDRDYDVILFEPLGYDEVRKIFDDKIVYATSLGHALSQSNIVFVSNPDRSAFSELPKLLKKKRLPITIIDPWGMFTHKDFPQHVTYMSHGRKNK